MKKSKKRGTTLTDDDIHGERQFGRRSFLRLTGVALVGASALVLGGNRVQARHVDVTDSDPSDRVADDDDPRRHRSDRSDNDETTRGDPVDEDTNRGTADRVRAGRQSDRDGQADTSDTDRSRTADPADAD